MFRKLSKDISESNMKKTGLYEALHDFSVDHRFIAVDVVLEIHKYLMRKVGI